MINIVKEKIEISICETCKGNTAINFKTGKCITCGSNRRIKTGKYYLDQVEITDEIKEIESKIVFVSKDNKQLNDKND